jgi:hypothetical protein
MSNVEQGMSNRRMAERWDDSFFSRHQVRRLRTKLRQAFEAEVFSAGNAGRGAAPDRGGE